MSVWHSLAPDSWLLVANNQRMDFHLLGCHHSYQYLGKRVFAESEVFASTVKFGWMLKSNLMLLQDWLQDPKGGNNFQKGTEDQLWDEADPSAYVTVWVPTGGMDIFSRWVTHVVVRIFHRT